jgi:site-specific recombinase XerD
MTAGMGGEIIPVNVPRVLAGLAAKPPAVFLPDEKTVERFFGFFTANIRNKNTRRAYYKAAARFSEWCESRGLKSLGDVKPLHVAAYVERLGTAEPDGAGLSKPTVKQHLAALRMLFDWLVVGHVIEGNPAHAVRGPKYSQKKGKTPVLDREEARALIAAIDTGSVTGLRDRALVGVMVYTFARVGAVLQMDVGDYFSQGRRGWVRLHEKGGKEHEAPCIPKLETYLDEYIAAAGIAGDKDGPLFRTTGRSTGTAHRMTQQDAYRMVQRHAKRAGIKTRIGNHSMRATGITDYLKSDGSLAEARKMANHADTRTTQLYDRRGDAASLDEYGKVGI